MSQPEITLHVWPGRWDLPSIDPTCLAAVMHLYLVLPGSFAVIECSNPDLSPSGQLPFLTHGHHLVSSLPSIVKYVASLTSFMTQGQGGQHLVGDIDAALNASEKSRCVAWCAHIGSNLGDLVGHMFYSLETNWSNLTQKVLVSMFPVPQRYYIPGRIRNSYRPRLEASGLWNVPGPEPEEKKPFDKIKRQEVEDKSTKYVKVFEREKTLEKARTLFDIYQRLLGDKKFFYHDRPTTIDIALAAHLLLLINAPFPDPLLQTLLMDSYPSLVTHARSVQAGALPPSGVSIRAPPQGYSLRSLIPSITRYKSGPTAPVGNSRAKTAKTDADIRFDKLRWGWIGVAASGVILYFLNCGPPIVIKFVGDSQEGAAGEEAAVDEDL